MNKLISNMTMKGKLTLLLAFPVLALVYFSVNILTAKIDDYREMKKV